MSDSDLICVGAIAGAYGVRGEVRLKSFCAVAEDIATYGALCDETGAQSFAVDLRAAIKGGFSARLGGVASKEQADALRGLRLHTTRAQLPHLPDDEYYHADLIGIPVFDTGGAALGTVKSVMNHGAGDLLEITPETGGESVLLPFTLAAVPTVDLAARRIVADPPSGVFPQ